MRFNSLIPAILMMVVGAGAGKAAPASQAQAQGIQSAIERYVGHRAAGSAVTVAPAGDAYTITLDLKALTHGFEALGFSLEPVSYTITVTPLDDGTWHIVSGGVPLINVKLKDQTISVVSNGSHFDGQFDARIPAFTAYTSTYDSLSIGMAGEKVPTQARLLQGGRQTVRGTDDGDGVLTTHLAQTNDAFSQDMAYDQAPANPHGTTRVTIKTGPTTEALDISGLHIRALSDLWTFVVAHPSEEAVKAAQADLKQILRRSLPLFKTWTQDASYEKVAVDSPIGPVTAKSFGAHFATSGMTNDGFAELTMKVAGLVAPTGRLPAWTSDLIPTDIELSDRIDGYHLDGVAQEAIDHLDLNATQPLPPETLQTMKTMLGPVDKIVLAIKPSRITSPALDTRFEGEVHFSESLPSYTITVSTVGLDKAVETIQAKAGQDPQAAQLIGGLLLAKGYAKTQPEGRLQWVIAGTGAGMITVNGVQLPIGGPK